MKKIIVLIAALVLFSAAAGAQDRIKWGIGAGYLDSHIKIKESGLSYSFGFPGAYVGVNAEFASKKQSMIAFATALNIEYKSFKINWAEEANAFYIRVPLHLKLALPVSDYIKFFVSVGPSLNVGLWGGISLRSGVDEFQQTEEYEIPSEFDPFCNGGLKRFQTQMGVTAGFIISDRYTLKFGYDYGLAKGLDLALKNRVNTTHIGLAYTF